MNKAWTGAGLVALSLAVGIPMVQAAAEDKPVEQMTCEDYLTLDETVQPEFIYYVVGHSTQGDPEAVLDVEGIDRIRPEIDEYCKAHTKESVHQWIKAEYEKIKKRL